MDTLTNRFVNIVSEDGTVSPVRYDQFVLQLFKVDSREGMLNHAVLGIAGEAGEIVDAIKKHTIYGKPLDQENVIEELGDIKFYLMALQNILGISDQELDQANANKLAKRYKGLTYSDASAIARADKGVQDV